MGMSDPRFSIILPTHNGQERIGLAITSVQLQTFTDYELIVVCDACTDDTVKYVENMYIDNLNDPHLKLITTNCQRDGLARNAGLDIARGEWILFLDDDDYFMHEYVLSLLSEQLDKCEEDVLDFGFIWKGRGYKAPSPDLQFVMVWCRAWRRSFIGDNRFCSEAYGSDLEFYQRMIYHNDNVSIRFWNMPLYYYNYMREGSLSWVESNKKYLDIIITHYDEPWKLGKPFFDMLEHQQCADLSRVSVTLVQDGPDGALPWDELFKPYSYKVNVLTLPHSGTGMARNAGIESTSAPWIMFCNFDDCFADVCSLSMYLENFPTDECDVIWSKTVQQMKWYTGTIYINRIDGVNFTNTDGKMYRREFLEDNYITFTDSKYYYDYIFNSTILAVDAPYRIMTLTTDFYPYYKSFRPDSFKHTASAHYGMMETSFDRDVILANEYKKRGLMYNYKAAIVRTLCRVFYSIYNPENENKPDGFDKRTIDFFIEYKDVFDSVSATDIDPIQAEVEVEVMNFIQNYYNEHKQEYYLVNDNISFHDWIEMLRSCTEKAPETIAPMEAVPEPSTDETNGTVTDPKVVVYCGTFDVYMNMVASLKSLLCRTPVDKVYFLIEDDVFPYELPDIVECINVKNQQYFPPDGPNFNNSWTWMCMIRAAFPEIFPQYDRILSLDVDIVINDDVSDLWDYDISDYYLAGVPERQRQKSASDPTYINFGVVMMNLAKLRRDGIQQPLIDALNTRHFGCPEQDAYNKFCAGHILALPADYNYTTYSHITADAQKERIIHYAGQKFWRHYSLVKRYSDLDWNEVMCRQNELKG